MITDSEFEDRVSAVNWMLGYAGDAHEVVGGKRVVEIGSGFGVGAIACLRNGADQYLGIEPEPFGTRVIQTDGYDAGFRVCYENAARTIDKRRALFLEGFADDWPGGDFDVCLIADVLEHVENPADIATSARGLLRQGGIVIASTSPLFLSAYGHHLFDVFPGQPWAHLCEDFDRDALMLQTSQYLISEFDSLNGVTHMELLEAFSSSGFEIAHERTLPQEGADFLSVRDRIKPEYLERFPDEIFDQCVSQFVAVKS
jgi:SAM-dependent methyltransferase